MTTIKDLIQTSPERYESIDGYTLQREQGETPAGNPIADRWVLRSPTGAWIDCNQYRHDLVGLHGLRLTST